MKLSKAIFLIILNLLATNALFAQTGASGTKGSFINFDNFVNDARVFGGDFEIGTEGHFELGSNAIVQIYGAVINNGTIEVDSAAQLTINGNMLNNGKIIVHPNASINFYGKIWKNTTIASVIDGAGMNTLPGGDVVFSAKRPVVSNSWLTASAYLATYSGGSQKQYIDGANIPMDITLQHNNENGIELLNTATRISGQFQWNVDNGYVTLQNSDFTFTEHASQTGYSPKRYAITSGTGHVNKENYLGSWVFPVGKDVDDYTPASIDNVLPNSFHVGVQDYDASLSEEVTSETVADGMQRTWNIYADQAVGASVINLQHNSNTNLASFSEALHFITRWSDRDPNNTGDNVSPSKWQYNTLASSVIGDLSTTGVVEGSSLRSRNYHDFATSATASDAFYTKATTAFTANSADMTSFKVDSVSCSALVTFKTAKEYGVRKFQLQRSTDGITYTTIQEFAPKGGNATYEFMDKMPVSGLNYYRVAMVDATGAYTLTNIITTHVECDPGPSLVLYPNPATDKITISGLTSASEIRILNMHGRLVSTTFTDGSNEDQVIDIASLPTATYFVQVLAKNVVSNIKLLKQ